MTDEEASVLARYAAGTSKNDIAIVMELPTSTVNYIIQTKGKDGSAGYIVNVLTARKALRDRVTTPAAAAPSPPATTTRPVTRPAPAKRAAPAPAPPRTTVTGPADNASPTVDATPELVQADPSATTSGDDTITDDTAAASDTFASPGAQDTDPKEDTMPATSTPAPAKAKRTPTNGAIMVPGPRAADLYADPSPTPEPVLATAADGDLVLPDGIEDVLQLAEGHTNATVRDLAAELRERIAWLRADLTREHRADGLRTQIAALDSEITVLTDKRDQLRRELEELFAGNVTVSASSGTLRKPAAPADDDEAIRQWAHDNNFEVKPHGDISNGVRAAYRRANGQ